MAIPTLEDLLFYDINDIIHLEANINYTYIHLTNKTKITASKTLKEFEELLTEDIFFRTHHYHLNNLNYIKRCIKGDGTQSAIKKVLMWTFPKDKKMSFLKPLAISIFALWKNIYRIFSANNSTIKTISFLLPAPVW